MNVYPIKGNSLQGKSELKHFNIEEEANGVDKAVVKVFKAVVTKTLEIRFHRAGKGTRNVHPPNKSKEVYHHWSCFGSMPSFNSFSH